MSDSLAAAAAAEAAAATTSTSSAAPAPTSAFSHADADIITHEVSLDDALLASTSAQSGTSIEDLYDIHATACKILGLDPSDQAAAPSRRRIHDRRFKHIALQFPDELIGDSVPIYWALKKSIRTLLQETRADGASEEPALEPELYILADTSYGSCCVDEVASAHVSADLVVHYGHACLSLTARLPTLYVFSKLSLDVEQAAASVAQKLGEAWLAESDAAANSEDSQAPGSTSKGKAKERHVAVLYEVGFAHQVDAIAAALREKLAAHSARVHVERIDTSANFEAKLAAANAGPHQQAPSGTEAQDGAETLAQQTSNLSLKDSCACAGKLGQSDSTCHAAANDGVCACSGGDKHPPTAHGPADPSNARTLDLPPSIALNDCDIVYIGREESLSLTNILLSHPPSSRQRLFVTYDPQPGSGRSPQARIEDGRSTNRLLMRRYALVQKAKDAAVVGLLVGTLGVASYLPLLKSLRKLLTGAWSRRKVYTISVGKLNPAKLANFQEIDIFVLVACPENSLALHGTGGGTHAGKDYFRPVITPFEMVVALRSLQQGDGASGGWEQGYELDLGRLNLRSREDEALANDAEGDPDAAEADADQDRPHFSLVTGSFVSRHAYQSNEALRRGEIAGSGTADGADAARPDGADVRTVALRQSDGTLTRVLDSASPAHLEDRAWKGLERRIGMDKPAPLEEGRAGIARGYAYAEGTSEGRNA